MPCSMGRLYGTPCSSWLRSSRCSASSISAWARCCFCSWVRSPQRRRLPLVPGHWCSAGGAGTLRQGLLSLDWVLCCCEYLPVRNQTAAIACLWTMGTWLMACCVLWKMTGDLLASDRAVGLAPGAGPLPGRQLPQLPHLPGLDGDRRERGQRALRSRLHGFCGAACRRLALPSTPVDLYCHVSFISPDLTSSWAEWRLPATWPMRSAPLSAWLQLCWPPPPPGAAQRCSLPC